MVYYPLEISGIIRRKVLAVSIVEVAKLAGVSKSTVSLVINDSPKVLKGTVEKVNRAMAEMGYTPSPRGQRRGRKPRGLLPSQAANIALVTLGIRNAVLRAPLYADVLHGIAESLRENHHRLTVYNSNDSTESITDDLLHNGADGILIFGRGESPRVTEALKEYPCVSFMGVDAPRKWCDWVGFDDRIVGELAADYLLKNGHKHFAYLGYGHWERGRVFAEKVKAAGGTIEMLDANGLVVSGDDVHQVDSAKMTQCVEKLLALNPRPTALFSWADMLTAALYPVLHARGIQIGRDLSIVTCNNEWPLLLGLSPRPAIVDVHAIDIGKHVVNQLIWRIKNRTSPLVTVMVKPSLISAP